MSLDVSQTDELVSIKAEGFHPGQFASSVHGSQARILQAIGSDLSYDDLICYGGFAFE
jgi:hypothetical protein